MGTLGSGREFNNISVNRIYHTFQLPFGKAFARSSLFKQEDFMPRKPRLEFPGAIYHINHRGNHQEDIYRDNEDRKLFLKLLSTVILRMN